VKTALAILLAVFVATPALGRGLGLTTVAEGVEDRDGWDILRAFGCDQAQGFLVSRPLAAERFREWMARQPESARPKVARPVTALDPSAGSAGAAVAAASASGSIAAAASASASSVAPASASVAVSAKSAQASRS